MSQRHALLAAAGITAFVLVVLGGLIAGAARAAPAAAQPAAPVMSQPEAAAPAAAGSTDYPVSADLASTIAGNVAPGARVLQTPEVVDFQGSVAYEVSTDRGLIYVDAATGQVLYNGASAPARLWAGDDDDDHDGEGERHEHEGSDDDD